MRHGEWTRALRRSVCAAVAGVLLAGASGLAQERVQLRREVSPEAYVKIWSGAGTVKVEGWQNDSLVVTGERTSEAGRFFQSVGDSLGKFGFYAGDGREAQVAGDLHVRVPEASTVWIKVASAAVEVGALSGGLDVFSVTGPVTVRGAPRYVHVESMAGAILVDIDSTEIVRVKGGRGDVTLHGEVRDLTVSAISGSIEVDSPAPQRAELESIDGSVTFRGGLGRGAWLSAETHTGDVDLVFPPGLNATLDLATVESRIQDELDGGSVSRPSFPGSRMLLETGNGEAEVEVRSFSGTIRVRTDAGGDRER